jgi:hypothetical protein
MLLFFFSLLFLNFEEDNAARIGHTIEHQIEGIEYEKSLLANITFGENITNVRIKAEILSMPARYGCDKHIASPYKVKDRHQRESSLTRMLPIANTTVGSAEDRQAA